MVKKKQRSRMYFTGLVAAFVSAILTAAISGCLLGPLLVVLDAWLASLLSVLGLLFIFVIIFAVVFVAMWRWGNSDLPAKDVEVIRSLLSQGQQKEARDKLFVSRKLIPGRFDKYLEALQSVPAGEDPAEYAWETAQSYNPPGHRKWTSAAPSALNWLPTQCLQCGAPVSEATVKRISSTETQCSHCGSFIKKP